jgi:tRNA A-37 threonylcarbamoyl transferase component Bud32
MRAMLDIFDIDNDNLFGLEDLISVLRTFEKNQAIPNLVKAAKGNMSSTASDDSANTNDNSLSTKTIGTQDSIEKINFSGSKIPKPLSSKKIKKVAKSMLIDAGFDKNSLLNLSDFTTFMEQNPSFLNTMQKAMKEDVWAVNSQSKIDGSLTDFFTNNSTSWTTDEPLESLSGYLKKKGRKSGGMKRRFYVIKGNFMYLYTKEGDDKPKEIMYLPNKIISQENFKGKFMIKIYTYDAKQEYKRIFLSDESECDLWFKVMQKAAKNEDITKIYKMKETLGVGKFSVVRKAYLIEDQSVDVAIKVISKKKVDAKDIDYMINELAALRVINHPRVPRFIRKFESPDNLYIVMENINGGDLFEYLVEADKLPYEEATDILSKLISIVKYLDELSLMHRDLKTENMLIKKRRGVKKIYLIDFGLAKFIDSREESNEKIGTISY